MIEVDAFHNRVEALEQLMQGRLGIRGRNLERRFARAGRLLPKHVRKAGRVITDAQAAIQHPRLARLQDQHRLNNAFSDVITHLETIDRADRRKGIALGILGGLVFNLIVLAAVLVALLRWQDVI